MPFLKEFPDTVDLADVMRAYPGGLEELLKFHDVVLRGPSPLSIGEREMLAAYVSRLNGCRFCFNSHRVYAAFYGKLLNAFFSNKIVNTIGGMCYITYLIHYPLIYFIMFVFHDVGFGQGLADSQARTNRH